MLIVYRQLVFACILCIKSVRLVFGCVMIFSFSVPTLKYVVQAKYLYMMNRHIFPGWDLN